MGAVITRSWCMPCADTFSMPPLAALAKRYLRESKRSVDPFARNCGLASITNDLSPDTLAQFHEDAEAFADRWERDAFDLVLFDPPYSLRQTMEVYQGVGREFTQRDTQVVGRWTELKASLARSLSIGGIAISCGWNTQGFGLKNGFEPVEYLILCHGGAHNDTLISVERKVQATLALDQPNAEAA